MAPQIPPTTVDGPPIEPFPFGLLSVLSWRSDGARWEAGGVTFPNSVRVVPGLPDGGLSEDLCGYAFADIEAGDYVPEAAHPFTLTASSDWCMTVGYSDAERDAAAVEWLTAAEQTVLEQVLWSVGPASFKSAATDLLPDAGSLAEAVATLEQEAATRPTGFRGVLHASRFTATLMASQGLAQPSTNSGSGVFYTRLGTPVVAGAGYDDEPTDADASNQYLYLTSPLVGYRSEISLDRAFDTSDNNSEVRASRAYVLTHVGPAVGVQVVPA